MSHSGSRLGAGAVALAVSISMVPTVAMAGGPSAAQGVMAAPGGSGYAAVVPEVWNQALLLAKKKKKKKKPAGITPEAAESKRQAIRDAVASDVEAENWEAAADETEANAALLGDPVSYQEAAEYRLNQAEADRDVDAAEAAIETATIALDIFNFYDSVDSGDATSQWLVIDPSEAASSASDVEDLIERAESLIEEIESEDEDEDEDEDEGEDKPKKERKKKKGGSKPGTVLIALGAAFTAVGIAGAAVGIAGAVASRRADDEVNDLMLPADQAEVDRLDEEGSRANRLGFIGVGMAGAGLAIGVPMLVVGVLRRKKGGKSGASARYRVVPAMTARYGGVALHGRF